MFNLLYILKKKIPFVNTFDFLQLQPKKMKTDGHVSEVTDSRLLEIEKYEKRTHLLLYFSDKERKEHKFSLPFKLYLSFVSPFTVFLMLDQTRRGSG